MQRAWEAGIKRHRVELLLPLIGATDLDDWPGGIRQQFKAVLPMVESMLDGLKRYNLTWLRVPKLHLHNCTC